MIPITTKTTQTLSPSLKQAPLTASYITHRMKYRHSIFVTALTAAALYALSTTAQAESTYLNPDDYTDNVTSGNYIDLWAYEDYLVDGQLKRSGLEISTSRLNDDGSSEVVIAGGDHRVGQSGEKGDIAGGKRGQSVTATHLTINGGSNIERVIGGNYSLGYVEGDRNITINGGNINYIYGGDWYVETDRPVTPNAPQNKYINAFYSEDTYGVQSSTGVWTPMKSDGDITITVTGGNVGQIRGGHNCAGGVINDNKDIGWSLDENGNETNLRPFSVGGNVNIVLEGGTVGTGSGDAIRGAGGSKCSVDGNVNITVKDDAVVNGNIYAGARNTYGQIGGSCITIEGGEVTGNIYGGGSWDTTSARTQGNTEIRLSGGKVNGNIYGAGDRDIVEGDTSVTILGQGTELAEGSIVSGGGINGAVVRGTRYLNIGDADIETTCSLNIVDFDEIIIASGSEATLNSVGIARSAMTLDNITLLTTTDTTEHTITLNLNGINTEKLTIAIQLTSGITELNNYSISMISNTLNTEALTTEFIMLDAQGNEISENESKFISSEIEGGTLFTISASVPEPTTATLSLLALAGLAARRRRK